MEMIKKDDFILVLSKIQLIISLLIFGKGRRNSKEYSPPFEITLK